MNENFGKTLTREEQAALLKKLGHKKMPVDNTGELNDFQKLMKSKKQLNKIKQWTY